MNKNSQLVVTPCATHPPCHKPALRAHLSRVCTCPRAAPTRTWAILPRRLHRHRLHRHRASRSTPAQSHGTQPVRTASREAEISLPSTPRRSTERPSRSLVGVTHGLGSMTKRTRATMCGRMGRRWTTMGGRWGSRTIMTAMRTVDISLTGPMVDLDHGATRSARKSLLTFA